MKIFAFVVLTLSVTDAHAQGSYGNIGCDIINASMKFRGEDDGAKKLLDVAFSYIDGFAEAKGIIDQELLAGRVLVECKYEPRQTLGEATRAVVRDTQ